MLLRFFKKVFDFFIFSSLFIAVCAVFMTLQTALLFELALPMPLIGFVCGGTVCSYNFHWYLTPPFVGDPSQKWVWTLRNRQWHLALAVAGGLAAAFYAWQLRAHWPWLLSTAFVTFLYSAPKLPQPLFRSLKKIAVGKTIFLAFAWTHVTTILPMVLIQPDLDPVQVGFAVNRFFLIYAICILFDYRDRENDARDGIRSMVTQFSEAGIDRLFWGSMIVFVLSLLFLAFYLPPTIVLCLLLPGLILAPLYRSSKVDHSDYRYYFVLDGLMMISAPLVILTKFG